MPENLPMKNHKENPYAWKGYLISGLAGCLLITFAIIGFLLSNYQKNLENNQEKIIEQISKLSAESKQERSIIQAEVRQLCDRLAKHEIMLDRHDWLLKMPFPERLKLYRQNSSTKRAP